MARQSASTTAVARIIGERAVDRLPEQCELVAGPHTHRTGKPAADRDATLGRSRARGRKQAHLAALVAWLEPDHDRREAFLAPGNEDGACACSRRIDGLQREASSAVP